MDYRNFFSYFKYSDAKTVAWAAVIIHLAPPPPNEAILVVLWYDCVSQNWSGFFVWSGSECGGGMME